MICLEKIGNNYRSLSYKEYYRKNKDEILNKARELCNMTRGARFTIREMKIIGLAIRKIRERRMGVK